MSWSTGKVPAPRVLLRAVLVVGAAVAMIHSLRGEVWHTLADDEGP
jgi:hypothetical protein